MKRARIFSAISLMLLSICILGAGVYAANTTDRHMGITGGVIEIPINLLGVSVDGYIGAVDNTPDFSSKYSDNSKNSTWSLMEADGKTSKLVFDATNANEKEDVDPITLTFVITNESDVALEAYFYKSTDTTNKAKVTNDYLGGSNNSENYVVGVALGSDNLAAATYKQDNTLDVAGTCTITITFTLNQLLDSGDNYDFSYVLQVQEVQ